MLTYSLQHPIESCGFEAIVAREHTARTSLQLNVGDLVFMC